MFIPIMGSLVYFICTRVALLCALLMNWHYLSKKRKKDVTINSCTCHQMQTFQKDIIYSYIIGESIGGEPIIVTCGISYNWQVYLFLCKSSFFP